MKVRLDGTLETQPVTATDLDIRNLDDATDGVRAVDAAETTGLLWQTINFSAAGANTIVTVGPTERLRLRRFMLTACSVPDVLGDPVLIITLGGVTLRSQVLVGRFDILGDAGEDLVITSTKTGQIDGSVAYTLETA